MSSERLPVFRFKTLTFAAWSQWLRKLMARIFDNIDLKFTQGLQDIITNTGVKRVDFCVGYFNLRGWDLIIDQIDQLPGDYIEEENSTTPLFRTCRLLIGMHQPPQELTRWL